MFRRGSCYFYFEDDAFLDFNLAKISEQKLGGKTPGKTKISLARTVAHRGHATYIFISRDKNTVYRAIN